MYFHRVALFVFIVNYTMLLLAPSLQCKWGMSLTEANPEKKNVE